MRARIFIGVDHGTTGIRFACIRSTPSHSASTTRKAEEDGHAASIYEISREDAARMSSHEILSEIARGLHISLDDVGLVALTYSMGDGISKITDIRAVTRRGLREDETAAGTRIGGGTRVFDAFLSSDMRVVLIPGIHADLSCVDSRMRFFSHGASPEKVGIAYHIFRKGYRDFIFSDISSNTVSVAVADGSITGAIDACIFAPGLIHGPLDLQLLRDVARGRMSANEAFSNAGVLRKFGFKRKIDRSMKDGRTTVLNSDDMLHETIALFAAMEISALIVLMRDVMSLSTARDDLHVFLTGAVGEREWMKRRISELLRGCNKCCRVHTVSKESAAIGCAEIARDVFYGAREILGIPVHIAEDANNR